MEEAHRQRESEFAAELSEKEAVLRQEFMHKLVERDQALMTSTGELEKVKFSLSDVQKKLEGESEDLLRSKHLTLAVLQKILGKNTFCFQSMFLRGDKGLNIVNGGYLNVRIYKTKTFVDAVRN